MSKELFKRQYLLVKEAEKLRSFSSWTQHNIGGFRLAVHPDIPLFKSDTPRFKIILVGFAFNIYDSKLSEQDFVETAPENREDLFEHLDAVSGNFALFVERHGQLEVYNDAAAAMKIFYHVEDEKVAGLASDPKLLQYAFDLEKTTDPEALKLYESETFKHHRIWVGSLTYYDSVKQLLPNHYLEVNRAETHRFFPRVPLQSISVEDSIATVKNYFDVIIAGVKSRYKMHCALTGGWDSRMVLSALKDCRQEASYFTFKRYDRSLNEADFKIPRAISDAFHLDYQILEFDEVFPFDKNLAQSYEHYGPRRFNHIQQGYKHFDFNQDVILVGTVAEICKNYFDQVTISNGKTFAQAAHYPVVPYVVDWFQEKYDTLKPLERFGYDLRDLGHWEQDITNFAGQDAMHSLSHVFTLPIFNNRRVLSAILAVPRSKREKQQHLYFKEYLRLTWPELNQFPVNASRKRSLTILLKTVGLFGIYKWITTRMRQ